MNIQTEVVFNNKLPEVQRSFRTRIANGLNAMANQVISISNPKTPRKSGKLRKNIVKEQPSDYERKVIWRQGYAAVQEAGQRKGVKFRHYTTPGTGAKFASNAAKQVQKNAARYF